MKKKGMFEEAGGWFLGIIIVVIILFIFFTPKQLFAKARDAVFNFGSGVVPAEQAPDVQAKPRVPTDLEQYYNNLVSKIKNSGTGYGCWVHIGQVPQMNDFGIYFYSNKVELQKIGKGLTPPEKSTRIEGFKPCSVKDMKANRFYYCMTNGIGCSDAFEEGNLVLDGKSKLASLLFRFDSSHICPIYLEGSGTDLQFGCGGSIYACVDQIKKTYSDCSNPSSPKKQFDECGAINFCYSETLFGNAHPEIGCTPSAPTAFFKTSEDCVKGSKCIKEHSKITASDCDSNNKEGDIWVWPKYIGGK